MSLHKDNDEVITVNVEARRNYLWRNSKLATYVCGRSGNGCLGQTQMLFLCLLEEPIGIMEPIRHTCSVLISQDTVKSIWLNCHPQEIRTSAIYTLGKFMDSDEMTVCAVSDLS